MGAFFCSPCFYGRVAHRLKHFPRSPEETGFSYMNGDCGLYYAINCLTGGFAFVISMMKRTEQREKFGIPGMFPIAYYQMEAYQTVYTMERPAIHNSRTYA